MKFLVKILFLALVGYILTEDYPKNQYVNGYFERCTGFCNSKYCKMEASCRPVNRTSKRKILDIHFHKDVVLDAPLIMELITYKKFATQYRPHLIKFKEEFCQHLKRKDHPLYKFFGLGSAGGNLVDPCPLSGRRYDAPHYTNAWVSRLVPTGEWITNFTITRNINGTDEHILTLTDYFTVKATGAFEF